MRLFWYLSAFMGLEADCQACTSGGRKEVVGGVLVMAPEPSGTEKAAGLHLQKHPRRAISAQISNTHS